MNSPLAGLVILDLSQLAQGPFATQILGDLGAEVIKVEPLAGDWMRRFALTNSYLGGESISFLSFNRNKRSIAVNAKYGFAPGSGKRISMRFAFGLVTCGMRHDAERLRAEYASRTGASKPGTRRL